MNKCLVLYAIIFLIFSYVNPANAQSDSVYSSSYDIFDRLSKKDKGKVTLSGYNISPQISDHIQSGKSSLRGCRIRVFKDNNQDGKQRAERVKSNLQNDYAGLPVYISYQAPYWYVDAGDFRSREEAENLKRKLQPSYPAIFVRNGVQINFPSL